MSFTNHSLRTRRWRWLAGLLMLAVIVVLARHWIVMLPHSRARGALAVGELERADRWLAIANWIDPSSAEGAALLARRALGVDDWWLAEQHLARAREQGKSDGEATYLAWLILATSGRVREAEREMLRVAAEPAADPLEMYIAFVNGSLRSRRSFSRAQGLLHAWLQGFPEDPRPHYLRARLAMEMQDWAGAEKALQRTLELDPRHAAAALDYGQLLVKRQQLEEARKYLRRASQGDSRRVEAVVAEARCLNLLGQGDEAVRLLEHVLRANPGDLRASLERARVDLDRGQPQAALDRLTKMEKLFPDNPDVQQLLARAWRALGNEGASQQHASAATRGLTQRNRVSEITMRVLKNPDDLDSRREVGQILLRFGPPGSLEDAMNWLASVLAARPDDSETQGILAEYFRESPAAADPGGATTRYLRETVSERSIEATE